jgi:hypothetical protein
LLLTIRSPPSQLAQLRHAAVVSATQRVAATKQLESIEQHNTAAAGQISMLQSRVTQAQAAEAAARAVAQRHKLMAQSLQKRAQIFAGKSIQEHKKSLAYAADAVKMKALSQQDALLTLNAINAMQAGKTLPKGSPSMEVLLTYFPFPHFFLWLTEWNADSWRKCQGIHEQHER